jgi:hypothetical protein
MCAGRGATADTNARQMALEEGGRCERRCRQSAALVGAQK